MYYPHKLGERVCNITRELTMPEEADVEPCCAYVYLNESILACTPHMCNLYVSTTKVKLRGYLNSAEGTTAEIASVFFVGKLDSTV